MITLRKNAYQVQFPYDPMLLQMLKNAIPSADRKWDANQKSWLISTQYENVLKKLFPNDRVPVADQAPLALEIRVIDLRYLGQVKDRGNGEYTAYGFADRFWSVIFLERVLRLWFEGMDVAHSGEAATLYGVLGLPTSCSAEDIKNGYRRMARQWHPDVCREPNANEIFLRIKEAYDTLSNPKKKIRYDVGLAFSAQQPQEPKPAADFIGYRAPLRCGYVLVEGAETLGRFAVSNIMGWEDIVNTLGRTLVTSWIMGDSMPTENWA